jgi:hypothetical protein
MYSTSAKNPRIRQSSPRPATRWLDLVRHDIMSNLLTRGFHYRLQINSAINHLAFLTVTDPPPTWRSGAMATPLCPGCLGHGCQTIGQRYVNRADVCLDRISKSQLNHCG